MTTTQYTGPWPYVFAFSAHLALALLLLIGRSTHPMAVPEQTGQVLFRLVPPPEGDTPIFMASSNPDSLPPTGNDSIPDAEMQTGGELQSPAETDSGTISDAELAEILAIEREALKAELERMTDSAMAETLPMTPMPFPDSDGGGKGTTAKGPEGAVRELNLDGFPQSVVDDIMKRYKLKVVTRKIEGGRRGQSFLSSATRGDQERYFGGMNVPAGVYEVFQLSRDSVALMSRLEEEALRAKGLEPLKARIIRIVFGIVQDDEGHYLLGVKSLEAEAVAP